MNAKIIDSFFDDDSWHAKEEAWQKKQRKLPVDGFRAGEKMQSAPSIYFSGIKMKPVKSQISFSGCASTFHYPISSVVENTAGNFLETLDEGGAAWRQDCLG